MVTYAAVTENAFETKRFLGFPTGVETRRVFDVVTLNRLWVYTQPLPITLELVNYGVDQRTADERMEVLDAHYANPFHLSTAWPNWETLVAVLAYRPDVVGVIDEPGQQARYGNRGIDMDYLGRTI